MKRILELETRPELAAHPAFIW